MLLDPTAVMDGTCLQNKGVDAAASRGRPTHDEMGRLAPQTAQEIRNGTSAHLEHHPCSQESYELAT